MRGQLSEAEVKVIMLQLLSAVQYLHRHGVWHRDIKSANILMTYAGGQRCGRSSSGGQQLLHNNPTLEALWVWYGTRTRASHSCGLWTHSRVCRLLQHFMWCATAGVRVLQGRVWQCKLQSGEPPVLTRILHGVLGCVMSSHGNSLWTYCCRS
jgi:serine/threonine protein kinase